MTSKAAERKGPWHHAAVAALQGASIEEQLQFLDPDLVQSEDIGPVEDEPGLGFGRFAGGPVGPAAGAIAAIDDRAAREAASRLWGRWDVHGRGRLVRR